MRTAKVTVRIHVRTRYAIHDGWLCTDGGTCRYRGRLGLQGPPTHAATRLRIRAGEQGARHSRVAGLPGAQEYPAHRQVHRTIANEVQGFLAITSPVRVLPDSIGPTVESIPSLASPTRGSTEARHWEGPRARLHRSCPKDRCKMIAGLSCASLDR